MNWKLLVIFTIAAVCGVSGSACAQVADASTLDGKIICGYQGWFGCPGDGNDPSIAWQHWSRAIVAIGPVLYNTDMWPDTSEYDTADLYEVPNTTLKSGAKAYLFSSAKQGVTNVHFRWMQENNIDGVLLERFTNGKSLDQDGPHFKFKNKTVENVKAAAKTYGRVWAMEYDITGDLDTATIYDRLVRDWEYLKKTYGIHSDQRYLRHNGKPVVMIFGLGFKGDNYPVTPQLAIKLINYFKDDGCWVLGGVPWGWRTLTAGSKTDPEWAAAYRSLNGIKPWTVGAYSNLGGIQRFKENVWAPDIAECNKLGMSYLPTAWPRFGWDNMFAHPCGKSKTSSRGGQHFWDQVYLMKEAGARTVYGAMFDEYDESTAMMKMSDDVPTTGCFWTNEGMPNDWHLRLLNYGKKMLRGEIPLSQTIPINPAVSADDARIIGNSMPSNMKAGKRYFVTVTVRNTGETCWNAETFKLGAVGDSDPFTSTRNSMASRVTVMPNRQYTFRFVMTAPSTPGTYTTDWQMTHERIRWFGGVVSKQVRVNSD